MEDRDRVVGGAAARWRLVADDAGIADAAHVHAILAVIVLAQALAGQLADAVDRGRVHDRELRRLFARRVRAEGGDRRWPEDFQWLAGVAAFARDLEDVEQAIHVQAPGLQWRFFAGGRQHGGQLVDLGDVFVGDQACQRVVVQHVQAGVARGAVQVVLADVRRDDVLRAVALGQRADQFTADLAIGADDEDAFHAVFPCCVFIIYCCLMMPSSRPACSNALSTMSSCSRVCAAESCTRTRAWPIGTTG